MGTIRMKEQEIIDLLILKSISTGLLSAEAEKLMWWRNLCKKNESYYQQYLALLKRVEPHPLDYSLTDGSSMLSEKLFDSDKKERENAPTKNNIPLLMGASIVILSILLLVCFFWLTSSGKDWLIKSTQNAQKTSFMLSDGTRVTLNAGSVLEYPNKFDSDLRMVKLKGEAHFDVTHDSSRAFVVQSGFLKTLVQGTSFNVKNYEQQNQTSVSLISGKLEVSLQVGKTKKRYLLRPGKQLRYQRDQNKIHITDFDAEEVLGWKNQHLIFKATRLKEAIQQIELWYDVNIVVKDSDVLNCKLTAQFEDESIETVIEALASSVILDYKFKDNKNIILFGNGCKY